MVEGWKAVVVPDELFESLKEYYEENKEELKLKHGNPRMFKVSDKLISMLNDLPKRNESIFGNTSLNSIDRSIDWKASARTTSLQPTDYNYS